MPSPSVNPLHPKAAIRPGVGSFFRVGFAAIAYALQSAVNAAALKLRGKAIPKD